VAGELVPVDPCDAAPCRGMMLKTWPFHVIVK
jgi:hypothetical protein